MRRQVIIGGVAAVAALAGGIGVFGGSASAIGEMGTLTMQSNANFSSQFPLGNAGEFQITSLTGQTSVLAVMDPSRRAGGSFFQTFCGQLAEDVYSGQVYTWTLDTKFNGTDPLLNTTAYLYQKFFDGTFTGPLTYDYTPGAGRSVSAKSLQLAIWQLQGQLYAPWDGYYAGDPLAQAYVADAIANAPAGIGNVRVLVLNEGSINRQDLLAVEVAGTNPGLEIVKTVDDETPAPFQPVTYRYAVTNTGGVTINGITVKDDNGTPADPADDFTVGTIASLAPGQTDSTTLFKTLIPPVTMCDPVQLPDDPVGKLYVTDEGDCWRIRYEQSLFVNDNSYGTTQSAGWTAIGKSHTFSNLTGSDKCQFIVKANDGSTVFNAFEDYITAKTNGKSGYETLGVSGGDGSVVTGNAAMLKSFNTSISETLNQSPAYYGFTVNSPKNPPNSQAIVDGWDFVNWYEICILKSAFPAGKTLGTVEIGVIHNSPALTGTNAAYPKPCDDCITNTAVATGVYAVGGGTVAVSSAPASATICFDIPNGGGGSANVTLKSTKFDKNKLIVELTNSGTTSAVFQGLKFGWPSGATENKSLKKIKTTKDLYKTVTAGPSVTLTSFLGGVVDRTIGAGKTLKFTFEFEATAKTDLTKYDFQLDFGAGYVTFIP